MLHDITIAMDDPYEILNISKNASEKEIKDAYHKLAFKYIFPVFFIFSSFDCL